MKKLFLMTFVFLFVLTATGTIIPAYWTGRMKYITTVTGKPGVQCEYDYSGQKFWKTFVGGVCPNSVEVQ